MTQSEFKNIESSIAEFEKAVRELFTVRLGAAASSVPTLANGSNSPAGEADLERNGITVQFRDREGQLADPSVPSLADPPFACPPEKAA
jgi:hypothetical protein